jgi:hypothetical protein
MPTATGGAVKASVSVEDISRQYYESAGYSMWITAMHVDPLELIAADDSSGKFYRVPIELSGEKFVFGEPQEVAINYVDVKSAAAAKNPARWTNRKAALAAAGLKDGDMAEGGYVKPVPIDAPPQAQAEPVIAPDVTPAGAAIRKMAATATQTPEADTSGSTAAPEKEALSVDKAKIKEGLGLAPDASDEEMNVALAALTSGSGSTPPAATPAPTGTDPASLLAAIPKGSGAIVLDGDNYKELLRKADLGVQANERVKLMERDAFLTKAMKDSRFPVAKLGDYQKMWDANPDATKAFIELMPKNAIPTSSVGLLGAEVDKNDADLAYEAMYGKAV